MYLYVYMYMYICMWVSMYSMYMSAALCHRHLSKVCLGNKSFQTSSLWTYTNSLGNASCQDRWESQARWRFGKEGKSCQAESTQQRPSPIFFDGEIRKQVQSACTKSWISQTSTISPLCWSLEFSRHTSAKTLWFGSVLLHFSVTTGNLLLKILHANWSEHSVGKK